MNNSHKRLIETRKWAETQSDRREVNILRGDLFWVLDEIERLQFSMTNFGFFQIDSDLHNDIQTESRTRIKEVR